jgi:TMEM175 potassium channel family protein
MDTRRVEAFSDGVFAIAITLLVLIFAETRTEHGSLTSALLHQWPSYIAYVVSFLTIGIMWVNHHAVMRQIGRVDRTFLLLTVVNLMFVAFAPYPTRVVAEFIRTDDRRAAALFYGISFTCTAMSWAALWFYAATGNRLIAADADPRAVKGITRSFLPGTLLYGGATLVAFLSAIASIALFGAITVFYALESTIFGRAR